MSDHYEYRYIGQHSLNEQVNRLITALHPIRDEFDQIVVQGMSGVIPGSIVASTLEKQLFVFRKPDEKTHGFQVIQPLGFKPGGARWIFLDDFVANGNTLARVFHQAAHDHWPFARYLVLYATTTMSVEGDLPFSHRSSVEYRIAGKRIDGPENQARLYIPTLESRFCMRGEWQLESWGDVVHDWLEWRYRAMARKPEIPGKSLEDELPARKDLE